MKIKRRKPSRYDVRRAIKNAQKAIPSEVAAKMTCFRCDEKSVAMHECLTCEKLNYKKFAIFACAKHNDKALAAVKKHALVKHPSNLLRVVAAGLKGEEI